MSRVFGAYRHRQLRVGLLLAVFASSLGVVASTQAAEPTPVTTRELDTGPNSELVSSIPIYKNWEPSVEKVVYSLPIPSVRAGEILRATGDVELLGSHPYGISASERLVIGDDPSNTEGTVVTPRANTTMTPQMSRLTLPIDGVYRPTSDLGTQYLKLIVKAPAWEAKEGDTLSVVPGSGELAVTRYSPTQGATSVPSDELQSFGSTSEQITSIPVDSKWRSVLSVDVGEGGISTDDLLELSGQLEIGNSNTTSVKLESRILAATSSTGTEPGPNGLIISEDTSDILASSNRFARIVQANEAQVNSSSKHYVNLLLRAVPVGEGSFSPLTIEPESALLNVLHFKAISASPASSLLPATWERTNWDDVVDKGTVPFAAEDASPVVVNSVPIDEMGLEEVFRIHGVLKADLNGGDSVPVETKIVLANTKTATSGEMVAMLNGDTIPAAQQVHTITKNATFESSQESFERKYLNLVVYANRAPAKSGEELTVALASVSYSRSKVVGRSTPPTPVTTRELDTGPNSELVSSIPIYKNWEPSVEKVVYSLPIPSVRAGEILRATGDVELLGSHPYGISASERLVIGDDPSNTEGTVVTPRANTTMTPQMSRLTLPIDGVYRPTSDLGTQYLKLIVKAPAWEAKEGDTLSVVPGSGELAVTRYSPTEGPTSLPMHELQSCSTATEELTSVPVDSDWHSMLSCDVGDVSTEDLLDLSGQLEVGNTNSANVRIDSRVLGAASPTASSGGTIIAEGTSDLLVPANRFARIVQGNEASTDSASDHYVNLLIRAVPEGSGSFVPITVEAGSVRLNVLRFKPNPADPVEIMRPGTLERSNWDDVIDDDSVPFAAEDRMPTVLNSAPIDELRKGDVIRARGVLTADFDSGQAAAPIETELIMADSPTATTGETVVTRSADTIPPGQEVRTLIKTGTFVAPKAGSVFSRKYLNLVIYANREPASEGEELDVSHASVSYSRAEPTAPFSADFEDGSLDQFFKFGEKTTSVTSNQAREGEKALQVDIDSNSWCDECDAGQDETGSIRRAMIGAPDDYAAGGFAGEDRWYGWSAYFPEGFKVPHLENSYFAGKIDEVRLYNQTLGQSQIETDEDGEYESTGVIPIAAYSFDESQQEVETGVTYDSTAGHHDGAIEGAEWTSAGKYGSALDFNGVKDFVRIPDAEELDLAKHFTLEAWVDPRSLHWWDPIISKTEGHEDHSLDTAGYILNAGGAHRLPGGTIFNGGEEREALDESGLLPTNTWSHLALTSDGTNLRIYVNGVLKATKLAIEAAPTAGDLLIGTDNYNVEPSGTWNLFTQWHHGSDGINCETNTSVPIGFNVVYWNAHGHQNPDESETPQDGDYIQTSFNGGQLDSGCNSIKPTQNYIVAPLHRGEWYDFVMHTRWTTEEGGPGNSVTSLWVNGKQVLGNQTIPIWKPTLYWKGSQAIHNSVLGWSAGLYRGPSAEDPTTRLFVDAVRTGESYAEVAPETHAPHLDAESYPASLAGEGSASFITSFGDLECGESEPSAEVSEAARQLPLSVDYGRCNAGEEGELSASVDMNSCYYTLEVDNAGPPYTGSLGVACEDEDDAIEFKVDENGSQACTASIGLQPPRSGLELHNSGEGMQRGFAIDGVVQGVEYEVEGPGCGDGPAMRKDGELSNEITLLGEGEGEGPVGVHLTGDEFVPRVEAENYGAILKGAGLSSLQTNLGTFECANTVFEGIAPNPVSQLDLQGAYGECGVTINGTHFVVLVKMNGCHYGLGIEPTVAAPYAGTWGVACSKAGEAIEFKLTKKGLNCLKLNPQEGHEGIAFSASGEGSGRTIGLDAEVKGLQYEWLGPCSTKGEVRTDGIMSAETTLAAEDEDGRPVGVWLAGEP